MVVWVMRVPKGTRFFFVPPASPLENKKGLRRSPQALGMKWKNLEGVTFGSRETTNGLDCNVPDSVGAIRRTGRFRPDVQRRAVQIR